jgi:hypothetical protein
MPGPADRILRLLYSEHVQKNIQVRDLLTVLDQMDDRTNGKMVYPPTVFAQFTERVPMEAR